MRGFGKWVTLCVLVESLYFKHGERMVVLLFLFDETFSFNCVLMDLQKQPCFNVVSSFPSQLFILYFVLDSSPSPIDVV